MPATMQTSRLHLRAPEADDAAAMFDYVSDPRATQYMVWPTATALEDVHELLEDIAWGWSEGDDYGYALIDSDRHTLIGTASCQFSDEGAELGFIVHPDRWGEGLATEAVSALMKAALDIDDLYRVWACCDADNPASAAVLANIGMQYEGRLRRRSYRPNLAGQIGPRDDLIYARVR